MSQATRQDVERVLKSLLYEIAPRDDKLHNYERTINQMMLKRLRFQKIWIGFKWFKDPIREAFDAWPKKTEAISPFRDNSHVTLYKRFKLLV